METLVSITGKKPRSYTMTCRKAWSLTRQWWTVTLRDIASSFASATCFWLAFKSASSCSLRILICSSCPSSSSSLASSLCFSPSKLLQSLDFWSRDALRQCIVSSQSGVPLNASGASDKFRAVFGAFQDSPRSFAFAKALKSHQLYHFVGKAEICS